MAALSIPAAREQIRKQAKFLNETLYKRQFSKAMKTVNDKPPIFLCPLHFFTFLLILGVTISDLLPIIEVPTNSLPSTGILVK